MNNLKSSQSNLKTLLAVGGWTHASVGFTEMVQTYERRQQFIQYAIDYLKHHSKINNITCIVGRPEVFCSESSEATSGYPRDVFRALSNIYDVVFCKNAKLVILAENSIIEL